MNRHPIFRFRFCLFCLLALSLLFLSGCFRSDLTRFYILNPISSAGSGQPVLHQKSLSVGVGPITLPDYLDRPQMVTRTGNNEIQLGEFDKWAGSLKYDIPRVLAENLSVLLGTDHVYVFPWVGEIEPDYQAVITINRFDATPGKEAVLNALWSLYADNGRKLLMTRKAAISIPMQETGYIEIAAAQSRALEELSRRIKKNIH